MKLLCSLLALSLIATTATASTLDIDLAPPTSVNHVFSTYYGLQNFLEMDFAPIVADPSSYSSIDIDMQMPAGQSIQVDAPAGYTTYMFIDVNMYVPFSSVDPGIDFPTTFSFLNLTGTAPTPLSPPVLTVRGNGNQMVLDVAFTLTESFSFTGFHSSTDGPFPNSEADINTYENEYGAEIVLRYFPPTDEGPFVSIVPEPVTAAMLLLGGGMLFRRRPRV